MYGFRSPFAGDDDAFDDDGSFEPDHLPRPGAFLDGHDVLVDGAHVDFHRLTRDLFEERGVYDMTFGYNLARLNLDRRHPNAGYRYAEEADDPATLRAEFTPTTPFCPQSRTLTVGSFRAWNGLRERHDYDLVRVRVAEMHHRHGSINEELDRLEAAFLETGTVPGETDSMDPSPTRSDSPF
ncbi:hypothetical protein [Halegenticoccus soli]|uniref:hypothetical protein n=1 Tax=Halegenticoccus soli TaxID=1985678 RepID=UPI000C6EBABA|nr:hypothetical protein [Halegenticoccus soli]